MAKKAKKKASTKNAKKTKTKKKPAKKSASKKSAQKNPVGRPPAIDKTKRNAIMRAIRLGASIPAAAAVVGVGERTIYDYLQKDEEFSQQFEAAKYDGMIDSLKLIKKSKAPKDHQWWLEKRFPKDFGKQVVDVNVGGQEDNPVDINLTGLSLAEMRKLLKEAREYEEKEK